MTRRSPGSPHPGPANIESPATKQYVSVARIDRPADIPAQIRRRAVAAAGMHPLPGRFGDGLVARDPLLSWPPGVLDGPATFGLDQAELRAEVRRRWDAGWQRWELRRVFDLPGLDAWAS